METIIINFENKAACLKCQVKELVHMISDAYVFGIQDKADNIQLVRDNQEPDEA